MIARTARLAAKQLRGADPDPTGRRRYRLCMSVAMHDRRIQVSAPRRVGRILGAATFAAALACLWLPFLMGGAPTSNPIVSGAPTITYTGLDLAFGGTADVLIPIWPADGGAYQPAPVTDLQM